MSGETGGWIGLVLAAGRSSRMGAGHKLLEDLDGKPVIRHVVDQARASRLQSLLLVTGYQAALVAAAAGDGPALINPHYQKGMASSLRLGVSMVPPDCAGVVVLLADMPFIQTQSINAMLDAIEAAPDKIALIPVVDGEWAHPVFMRRIFFPALMGLEGDQGARALLKKQQDKILFWPSSDRALLFDLDTPDALRAARMQILRKSGSAETVF